MSTISELANARFAYLTYLRSIREQLEAFKKCRKLVCTQQKLDRMLNLPIGTVSAFERGNFKGMEEATVRLMHNTYLELMELADEHDRLAGLRSENSAQNEQRSRNGQPSGISAS